jgi:hypothetical protein
MDTLHYQGGLQQHLCIEWQFTCHIQYRVQACDLCYLLSCYPFFTILTIFTIVQILSQGPESEDPQHPSKAEALSDRSSRNDGEGDRPELVGIVFWRTK